MIDLDSAVCDPRFLPYHGWHDDHRHHVNTPEYRPAAQQNRSEFHQIAFLLQEWGLCRRALQIGLGVPGGTHFMLRSMFDEVLTIDSDASVVSRYGLQMDDKNVFFGDSHCPRVHDVVMRFAPFDFLLIDGDHSRKGTLRDWVDYAPLVRRGGAVALHDAICLSQVAEAVEIIKESHEVQVIGTEVGIAVVRM